MNPNQKLTLSQQARMKSLEYDLPKMSREQLEQFCLDLALSYLIYQNGMVEVINNMARQDCSGLAGDPGF